MFDTCWAPRWRASRRFQEGAKAHRPPRLLRRSPSSLPLVGQHLALECVIHRIIRQHGGAEGRILSSVIVGAGLPLMRTRLAAGLEIIAAGTAVCARGTWRLLLAGRARRSVFAKTGHFLFHGLKFLRVSIAGQVQSKVMARSSRVTNAAGFSRGHSIEASLSSHTGLPPTPSQYSRK